MKLSRRSLLAATTMLAIPAMPAWASPAAAADPQVMGELWGMPYLASGALGNLPHTKVNR